MLYLDYGMIAGLGTHGSKDMFECRVLKLEPKPESLHQQPPLSVLGGLHVGEFLSTATLMMGFENISGCCRLKSVLVSLVRVCNYIGRSAHLFDIRNCCYLQRVHEGNHYYSSWYHQQQVSHHQRLSARKLLSNKDVFVHFHAFQNIKIFGGKFL